MKLVAVILFITILLLIGRMLLSAGLYYVNLNNCRINAVLQGGKLKW